MEELKSLVVRAQAGDLEAYGEIVRRFQDLAYGYAYSVLGDFHLAEDAAQEAFIEAYRCLGALREPAAFPGWFRRIVFKHCDRIVRRRRSKEVPLGLAASARSHELGPPEVAERREVRDSVLQAIHVTPRSPHTTAKPEPRWRLPVPTRRSGQQRALPARLLRREDRPRPPRGLRRPARAGANPTGSRATSARASDLRLGPGVAPAPQDVHQYFRGVGALQVVGEVAKEGSRLLGTKGRDLPITLLHAQPTQ